MKLIFLDFDGVLVTNSSLLIYNTFKSIGFSPTSLFRLIDGESMKNLNELIDKTKAKIVITSQWRRTMSLGEIKGVLVMAGFKYGDMILNTNDFFADERDRGDEIANFLAIDELEKFIIIDDSCEVYSSDQRERLVCPDPEKGFTKADMEKAITILTGVDKKYFRRIGIRFSKPFWEVVVSNHTNKSFLLTDSNLQVIHKCTNRGEAISVLKREKKKINKIDSE
ncbi:MAG: hypothetical protein LCH52_08420 [Bacteroidetes bacterium]|nr:hypothetical protein [Bacteroidota bacterium]